MRSDMGVLVGCKIGESMRMVGAHNRWWGCCWKVWMEYKRKGGYNKMLKVGVNRNEVSPMKLKTKAQTLANF